MKTLSSNFKAKRDSLYQLSRTLGVDLDAIPYNYPNEPFTDHLTQKVANQALDFEMDESVYDRLSELCNMTYNRDIRSAGDYGVDLIYGWLSEDIVIEFLLNNDFTVDKQGVDSERHFLQSNAIKSDIDILISKDGKSRNYDVYFDSQGYWNKTDRLDLRESKWKELTKTGAGVLCISNYGFAIVDATSDYSMRPNPLWGGKVCATVEGIKDLLVDEQQFLKVLLEDLTI